MTPEMPDAMINSITGSYPCRAMPVEQGEASP
jgi:hypothetical protein